MQAQYFYTIGNVLLPLMAKDSRFHYDNAALCADGHLPTLYPIHIPGAVPLEAQQYAPTGTPLLSELAETQQQCLIQRGIGLHHNFYLDSKHVLGASYLLDTALCYIYCQESHMGWLVVKDDRIYEVARTRYPLPAPSKSVQDVLSTTMEEVTTGKIKVGRITQESESKWSVLARQFDMRPSSGVCIFPAYAVECYILTVFHALANGAYEIQYTDVEGVKRTLTTTLNANALAQVYRSTGYAAKVMAGVRSKTGFAELILPDFTHSGELATVNVLSILATRRVR